MKRRKGKEGETGALIELFNSYWAICSQLFGFCWLRVMTNLKVYCGTVNRGPQSSPTAAVYVEKQQATSYDS